MNARAASTIPEWNEKLPMQKFTTPQEIASEGTRIYDEKYRSDYEAKHAGQFVAIDVKSQKAFVATQPEEAIRKAQMAAGDGIFHLIKIGSPGAFRVSYTTNDLATGFFDKNGSPSIKIKLAGAYSTKATEFELIVDTGFSGFISMPIIRAFPLGLPLTGTTSVVLADGKSQTKLFASAKTTIGNRTEVGLVILEESSSHILVGMDFLRTFKLAIFVGEKGITVYDEEQMNKAFQATRKNYKNKSKKPENTNKRVKPTR